MKRNIIYLMIALSLSTIIIMGCGAKGDKSLSTNSKPTEEVKEDKSKKEIDKKEETQSQKDTAEKKEEDKTNDKSKKPVEKNLENSKKDKELKPVDKVVTKPVEKPITKPIEKPQPPKVEKPKDDNINIASKEIYNKITKDIEGGKQISMEDDLFKESYGIDNSILDDYCVMMPMMIVKARECAIFKVKDIKDSEKVLDGINKRLNLLENTWKQYLPDQYELVKNNKVIQKENYILFVIDEHADKIVQNFNSIIK